MINDRSVNDIRIQWQDCKNESGEYSKCWENQPQFYSNQYNQQLEKRTLKACLVIVLRHSVLAVLSDLKINIYEVEFPTPLSHTTSKWTTNYNTFCHVLLLQDK